MKRLSQPIFLRHTYQNYVYLYGSHDFANRYNVLRRVVIDGSQSDRACTLAREQLSISAIIEMAVAARSIATIGGTTPRHVTTLSIPLSPGYRVAIDSSAASVHIAAHPPFPRAKCAPLKSTTRKRAHCSHWQCPRVFLSLLSSVDRQARYKK